MDKVEEYKAIIKKIMDDITTIPTVQSYPLQTQKIIDDVNGHYLIYKNGWRESNRIYGCIFHLEVTHEGKVWLHHDGTDLLVGQQLIDAGVPKSSMVIGFHEPAMRAWTDFAVA